MPTPIFLTVFEHGVGAPSASGQLGLWDVTVTAGITAVITPVNSGTYACEVTQSATNRNSGWNFSAADRLVARFYVRFASLPAATVVIAHTIASAGNALLFRFNQSTGKFNVVFGGVGSTDGGVTVATDTWYRIDLNILFNAATRTCDWQV